MSTNSFGIHWFRRDLRVAGNPALLANWRQNSGKVVGLFCFDSRFLARSDFSHNRFAFFMDTLSSLRDELRMTGGDLLVVDEQPSKAFPKLIEYFQKKKWGLSLVTYNRDYEPFARDRDRQIENIFCQYQVEYRSFRDHLLIEPEELDKGKGGTYYQVYSPFAKKWFDLYRSEEIQKRIDVQRKGLQYLFSNRKPVDLFRLRWRTLTCSQFPYLDQLESFHEENKKQTTIDIPPAGSAAVCKQLKAFKNQLDKYRNERDSPYLEGTSRFSLFLKNGSLTTAQILFYFNLQNFYFQNKGSQERFLKEIVWREFYYHILYHHPEVETEAFIKKYKNIRWKNDKECFAKWCKGETGFPIVDAGMRQLNTTGWMHNRVRMIVSSFLTKDLLIDWRWGERYFMEKLLDGDLAPNNGGWQWAASTGCDPQPYFRIFNPWLQAKKFDPDAQYIRQYVPELRAASAKEIHDEAADRSSYHYPAPMVKHAEQKVKALKLYSIDA